MRCQHGSNLYELATAYMEAKASLLEQGYESEIDWQEEISFDSVDEQYFLREAAWVILSSGMRESVIRRQFPGITHAFLGWESARRITEYAQHCFSQAILRFNHPGKINAILHLADHISLHGFKSVKSAIERDGIEYMHQFAFMGPATTCHLAKNIGLRLPKPDRHLVRLARSIGYPSAHAMCCDIADVTDENVAVVDLVIWRFATLHRDYVDHFLSSVSAS